MHLISAFSTPFHTCLVLEYSPGGELFEFLADHHMDMSEALARRMFCELVDALAWTHGIGLVHRDIKLESESLYFVISRFAPWLTSARMNSFQTSS